MPSHCPVGYWDLTVQENTILPLIVIYIWYVVIWFDLSVVYAYLHTGHNHTTIQNVPIFMFLFFSSFFLLFFGVLYNLGSCMYHVLLQFFHMNLHSTRYDNMLGTLWQFFDLVLSRNIIEVGGIQISAYYLCSRCCWCPHCLQTDARRCWLALTLTDWLCDLLRSSVSFHTRLYLSE